MNKKDKAIQFLVEYKELLQCPICKQAFFEVEGNSVQCERGHSFDVSKKGTVYFLLKQVKSEYNRKMLESRTRVAKKGLWHPLLKEIYGWIEEPTGVHLDVGCGEGSHLNELSKLGLAGQKIGFDISKEAIQLAATQYTGAFWCVADLVHSPFASHHYDTILNILSPSNYTEFNRLLHSEGQLIKVVPNAGYLKELRKALYEDKKIYSNERVVKHFFSHYPLASQESVSYTVEVNAEDIRDLIKMTPLGWQASERKKKELLTHPFAQITVDLTVLVGKRRE